MKKRFLFPLLLLVLAFSAVARAQQTSSSSPTGTRPRTVSTPAPQQQTPDATPTTAKQSATQTPTNTTPTPSVSPSAPPVTATLPPATSTSSVVVVPSVLPAPFPALQPAHPISLNKARTRITEAQRLLKGRLQLTASSTPPHYLVTLAALDPDTSQIHLMTLTKQTLLTRGAEVALVTSQGMSVRLRIVRPNYVNTAVVIADPSGRQLTPLLIEYPIEKFGKFREMAYYTSVHPALLSPELVKTGQAYVRTMLDLAAERLKSKGYKISPEILDVAERLCIVEHVDHERFRNEPRLATYEEIYALYALNELDTYRYSVSSAGAGGMVQMIPWAYQMIRQNFPGAGLNPDFVLGMRNHGNALEAMLLYIHKTWNDLLLNPDVADAYRTGVATQAELIAAGYNSNAAKLGGYIRRAGTGWRTLIPRETQIYLQIYKSFESFVPLKTRADKT